MGKRRNLSRKEEDQLQRLKREVEHLKRENSRYRKELARIDLETYDQYLDIEEHEEKREVDKQTKAKKEADYAKKWTCHECKEGILKLIVFNRLDGTYYSRRCNVCGKKTKVQKYDSSVDK